MQTNLPAAFLNTAQGQEADAILRSCVHCGFCTATCPTYQLLGDELDGPRGRIYLIKQMLEGGAVTARTQQHLDRCLTCRACETTCPSGVRYARLLEIGRGEVERQVGRSLFAGATRWGLRQLLPYPKRFALALRLGQLLRPLLPERLKQKLPGRVTATPRPAARHRRTLLVLEGCAQSVATPNTNAAAARVLDRLGISLIAPAGQGCCGAVSQHLAAESEAAGFMRRNIDAWWPHIEAGVEGILVTASGCGTQVKEYGDLLQHDPLYADKARRVSELARDLCEVLEGEALETLSVREPGRRIAYHSPCSLQHGQQLAGRVEALLGRLGFELTPVADSHLCCGSAGTYSILQPELSQRLLENKLAALEAGGASCIATANVGCQLHLQSRAQGPVKHWIELLDEALA
ncbi:glycolate oxidase subunit GlcF [Sedimenticola thiotaurini]|uniref:Glycolate oxidase iron-sulfur subunit n=1 Tax=Sedimenticola thiotaurini TaxID=1543721 RepID=A0A0F7K064_9GAMM|nr:glycolate oxidase subunit GlcF [Sedimenticola thiotaurini]AKH20999.1 glycolate oxidase iron-sulfur subunit [Sedimenticola thiotaurini]